MKSERPSLGPASSPAIFTKQASRLEQQTLTTEQFSLKPPALRNRAVLVRMDSSLAGQVVTLDGPELRIGRHPDNQIVVDDEGLSRAHARIFMKDGQYFVADLGSSNGTYVNGERVAELALYDGAVVQLGPRVCLKFSLTDENQERIYRQLYETSVRDPLTGAHNRLFFQERLASEIAYAERHNAQASLLLFDVDHFKMINDTHGHPAGDEVLKGIAKATAHMLREEDVFARYGGEEFVVLLRGVSIAGAGRAGERLRRAIEEAPIAADGKTIPVTVSVGCASLACAERLDAEALIGAADRRLYAAKREGRNRVVSTG